VTQQVDGSALYGVSCPSSGLCVAVDSIGNVVTGTHLAVTTTTTAVASSSNPSTVGGSVTYTATVAPTPNGGTMAFTDNAATLSGCAAVAVNTSTGKAACTTSYGAAGSHDIVASYSGDANYQASSGSLTQHVSPLRVLPPVLSSSTPALTRTIPPALPQQTTGPRPSVPRQTGPRTFSPAAQGLAQQPSVAPAASMTDSLVGFWLAVRLVLLLML
jgi:hypothetical protein